MNANPLGRRVAAALVYALAYLLVFPVHIFALPQGGRVAAGKANITRPNQRNLHIQQATGKTIINWERFSIARPEAVRFFQPSEASIALNRVVGVDPSALHGLLSANGNIFLINPNGILVGPTGRIEANNFIASTLDMADRDFLQGKYTLVQDPAKPLSAILNLGIIESAANGSVSLIAPAVENQGTIAASLGRVNLGAGEQVTLSFAANEEIRFAVERPVTGHVVRPDGTVAEDNILNTGVISADGGEVVLTAKSAFDAVKSVVNNTGVIEAKSLEARNGTIRLDGGDQGAVFNSGTLDASGLGAGETGGQVTVTGEKTALVHYSKILASGNAGGGKVFIGGGDQGKDLEIKNGKITYVGEDAVIDADAVEEGDGGQVVVWSDDTTEFGGRISARGGRISGDGGSVEVSGKMHLRITGHADLTAPNGRAGTFLLDPGSVTIQDGTDTAPPGSMDIINDGWVNSQLSLGLLTVTTADSTNGLTQDITMDPTVNDDGLSLSLSNTLALTAGNDISLDGSFSGAGGLTLNANRNVTLGGTHTASGLLTVNLGQGGAGGVLNQNNVDVSSYASASAVGGAGGDTFTINAAGFDTLSGGGGGDQFNISAAGDVATSISGGAGDDVFNLDKAISGSIAGGTGGEAAGDTLDFAGIGTAQSATLTSSLAANQFGGTGGGVGGGFSEISIAVGNGGTLTGEDAISTWTLDGGPTENYNDGSNDLAFSGFAALQGGSLADTFDVSAAGAYDVAGGDGDDHFNLNASASGTFSGEGGSDAADIQTAAFDITGSGLALDVETVANSGGGTLAADSLDFGAVAGLGAVGAPLSIAVDSLSIAGSTGDVYLSEADAVDLGAIQAGANLFSLVSGGAVTDAGAATVAAGSVSLETTGGIGTAALPLLLSTAQIEVNESGPGAEIHINNAATAGVTVSSMTIGTGDIFYGQTGNQSLLLASVSAGDGDITIANTGGAGADIDIGSVSADTANDTVSITAAGHIQESGTDAAADVTAATISLQSADGGIGGLAANALEINATVRFDADTSGAGGSALSIADVAGDLPLGDIVLGVNDGTLTSVGAMTDAYDGDDNLSSSGQVVLGAAAGIGAADAIETTLGTLRFTSAGGAVRVDNTGALTLGLGASSAGGAISLGSTNGITVDQDLSSTAGAVALDAGTGAFTVGGGSTVTAGGAGDLTVTAADIALTGNLDAAGDSVYLFPSDVAAPLYVGTAGGGWSLTTAEVQNITATTLVVGRTGSQTGTILIDDLNDSGGAISTNFEFYADGGAGSVVFDNTATNTDQQPGSTSRLFVQADDIQVDAGITAADRIEMITTNGGDLRFTSGVTVTNGNQEIDLDTIAGSIDLAVAGGTVTLDAPQGSVRLDDVLDSLADDTNLTVSAGGDVTVGSASIGAGTLAITVDSDNNTNFHTGTFGALTAGTLTVSGGTDGGGNERFFFNGAIHAGSLTVVDGAVATVGADIQTTAGDIDFSDVPSFVLGAGASVALDTNGTGDVLFGAAIDGTATGNEALIVDTRDASTGGGIDGNVGLGTVGTTTGSGTEVGLLSVLADTGTITLNGDVFSSANGSRSGAVTFGSTVALTADTVINTDGGAYDSSGTETVSSGGPWNLSVTTTDGAGTDGGSVSLGAFGNNGGLNQYVSSVAIDSTDTGSSGAVTLNKDILLQNHVGTGAAADFTIAGSPRVIISDDTAGTALTIDTEQDNANAPGIVDLGSGNLSADAAGYTLEIRTTDTSAGGTSGGDVTLGPVNSVGGSFFLASLQVDATSTNGNDGTINLEGNIATDEGAVVLAGDVEVGVAGTLTVSTEQGSDGPAGDIDLSGAAVGAANTPVNLTLNAGTVGGAGGTATLGSFEPPTGLNRINDLTVFTFGTTDGAVNVPSALTVDGAVRFSSAARVDIDADLTAGNAGSGALTIQDTAEVLIDASAPRTITAAGAIHMDAATDGVSQITLDDGGSVVTLASGGSVRLAPLRADNAPVQPTGAGLAVEADGSATLSAVDLSGTAADGSLSVAVDADTGGVETLTIDGAVTRVAGITLGGDASDDTVDINAAMTAGAGLTVQNAQTIDIAGGLTLTAQGGALDLNNAVSGIVLGGGGTTTLQTGPGDGALALADVSGAGDNLTVSSTSAVTLGSIDLSGGNLSVTVDSDDDSGALTLAVASAVTNVGNVTLQGGTGGADGGDDVIDIDQSLTAGGYLTVGRAEEVQLLGGTTLDARGGALTMSNLGATGITLNGGGTVALQTTTAGDFDVDVAAVTSTGGENLTISSRGNASLQGPVNLGTGNLDITIDSNADSTNSLSVGQTITATNIDLSAGGAANGDTIFISQGVSAGGHLVIDNVQTVDIASGLTLEAAGGSLDLNNGVGGIVLGTGGTTILQATTADSNVELAAVSGAGDDLTISATADAVLSAIDLSGGDLSVTVDSDDDSGALTLAVSSAVTNVGNVTLQGGTGGTDGSDDIIDIDRSLTAAGSLTVQNADEIQLLAGKTLTAEGGSADLNNNIGAGITLNGAGTVTVQTTTADNDVELAAVAGSGGGQSLAVSSTRDVALSAVDLAGGNLTVTVDSDNDAGAVSTLAIANTVTNVDNVTLQGGGLGSDDIIDVDQAITSAGYQLFQLVSGVRLSKDLTTSGGEVTFRSPVTLDGNVSVDTTDGGGSAGATIGFNSTLDGSQSLGLTAGVGALAFQGAIGSGTPLGDLTVVSAASVTTDGVLNAASVDIQDGGAVDLNGAIAAPGGFGSRGTTFDNTGGPIDTASGTGAITVNHTGAVTIGGALSSASGAVDIDSTGATVALYQGVATTDGDVTVDASGATTISGGGNISTGTGGVTFGNALAGTLSTAGNITTGGGAVTFSRNTTLAGSISISTGAGGGDILFSGALDGTAAGAQSLTLTAGTGHLTFDGTVGATRLGALTVNSAAGSAGDYNGDPSLATATISINAALAADSVDIADGGNVAVNGAVTAPGGFSSAGTGYFDNTGGSITTSGAPVSIRHTDAAYGTVAIAAGIDTGNGGTVNGGDVAIDGGYEVIVDALIDTRTDSGTLGSLTVGGGVTINTSPILGAGSVDLNKNITATQDRVIVSTLVDTSNSISITAPRDIIIGALVQATAPGADVILTADSIGNGQGGVLVLDGGQVVSARDVVISGSDLYATGAGFAPFDAVVVEADSGGNPQIQAGRNIELKIRPAAPAGADIVVDGVLEAGISDATGFIDMDAADQIQLAATLSTTGGNLVFRDPVLLGGDTQVDSAGGNILFSGTLDGTAGTEALDLTAGAGNITFSGDVGVGTGLGDVSVVSVHDLLAGSRFRSISLIQAAGNGTSRFDGAVALTGGFNLQTGAVDINHDVSTDGGAVTLIAAGGVDLAAGRTISTTAAVGDSGAVDIDVTGSGSVNLAGDLVTAGGSGVAAGSGGQVDITTTDGAVTVADITTSGGDASGAAANGGNAGAIHIATAGAGGNDNLTLAGTLTASGGSPGAGGSAGSDGNVNLVSVDSLVDGNGGTNNVAGGALTIAAADGIGSNDPIETAVSSLDLVNTAFGNVRVNEADDVDVVRIDQNASGIVTLLTTAGSITLTGGGSGVSAAGGAIRLDAGGADADLSVNQTVTSAGSGAITLEAGDGVFFSGAGDVTAGGASGISVAAGADGGAGDSGGVVFMANGAVADAGSGAIAVSSVGDVTLGSLATSSTSSSAVVVVSSGGSIIDGGDSPAYDVDAQRGRVEMTAAGGIGDANPLEIRASSADAHATAPGNIRLDAVGDLVLRDVDTTRGTISVSTTGGSLNAQDVRAGGGRDVDLAADGDLILGTVSAGVGQMTLFSGGDIDRGTITADRATLTAKTAGLSKAVTIDVNENRLFVNLADKNASGVSGVFDKGPALNAKPPKANLVALGTVIFEGLGTFLAGELADIEGAITSLATASKEQEILDEMLRAAREAQYFMTAPLEIFIEMEEEEKDKRKEENEAFNRLLPDPGRFLQPRPAAVRPSLLSDMPVPRPPGLIPEADGATISGIRIGNSLDRSVASLAR